MTYLVSNENVKPQLNQSINPGGPLLGIFPQFSSFTCSGREPLISGRFLLAGCPSCHPTNSVTALTET